MHGALAVMKGLQMSPLQNFNHLGLRCLPLCGFCPRQVLLCLPTRESAVDSSCLSAPIS